MTTSADAALPEEAVARGPRLERGWILFLLFLAVGSIVLTFTLFTVNHRRSAELGQNRYSQRSKYVIEHWMNHGFFRSGGLMYYSIETKKPTYYYHIPGSYMVSGFLVEKIHWQFRGRYNWRLLALHNELMSLLLAVVVAMLAFRMARRFGIEPFHAFALGAAVESVMVTFPDNLNLYWEYYPQPFALIFAVLFLLIEERRLDDPSARRFPWNQILAAFGLLYGGLVFGVMFLVAYSLFLVVIDRGRLDWPSLLARTVVPLAVVLALSWLQVSYLEMREPGVEISGSTFLYRSGLDGSVEFYGGHGDVAFSRDRRGHIFPGNHATNLRWTWMFAAGMFAFAGLALGSLRGRTPRFVMLALWSLIGSYFLYASLFSQSVVIHPYLFDLLLATPLILALFAAAPALWESLARTSGAAVLLAVFGALCYSMVQMRVYAIRYPRLDLGAKPAVAEAAAVQAQPREISGEWIDVPYDPSAFSANRGARWEVEKSDVSTYSYSLVGSTMTLAFHISDTSVAGGMPTALELKIPAGRRAKTSLSTVVNIRDDGTYLQSKMDVAAGSNLIQIRRTPTGLWAASHNRTDAAGEITLGVQ